MIKLEHALLVTVGALISITYFMSNMMDEDNAALRKLQGEYYAMQDKLSECQKERQVTVTMYHPVRGQTDDTPNITADGTRISIRNAGKYRFVAVSRDLLRSNGGPFEYGDYIILEGINGKYDGVWQVKDTMHPRWDNRVDILCSPGTPPFKVDSAMMKWYPGV